MPRQMPGRGAEWLHQTEQSNEFMGSIPQGKEINIEVCDDTGTSQPDMDEDDYGHEDDHYSDSHYLMKRSGVEQVNEEDSIRIQVLDDSPAIVSPNVQVHVDEPLQAQCTPPGFVPVEDQPEMVAQPTILQVPVAKSGMQNVVHEYEQQPFEDFSASVPVREDEE